MIKGIDISKWQGAINYDTLQGKVDFVIARSSYGTGYTDEQFARNRDELRRRNVPHGFYHYAYPTYNSPEAEADWFLQVVGVPQDGEMLCLDFEEKYGDPVGWSKAFLDRLSSRLNGYKPLIYINLNLVNTYDWAPVVQGNYGLWLARWDYNPDADLPPVDWQIVAMRQYANNINVGGITPLDADVFYGDVNAFKRYGYHAPAPVQTVPLDQYNADIAAKQAIIDDLTGKLNTANQSASDWEVKASAYAGQITVLQDQNKRLTDTVNDLTEGNKILVEDTGALTEKVAELEKKIAELTATPTPEPTPTPQDDVVSIDLSEVWNWIKKLFRRG